MNANFSFNSDVNEQKYSRRKPHIETTIGNLQQNGKYCILGSVNSISETGFQLKDDSGIINVTKSPTIKDFDVEDGMVVRVYGYVETEPEVKISATIIQNLNSMDLHLYQQMRELEETIYD